MSDGGTDNPAFSNDECQTSDNSNITLENSHTESLQNTQITVDDDRKQSADEASSDKQKIENGHQHSFVSQHYVEPVRTSPEPQYKTETRIELPADNQEKIQSSNKSNGINGNGNNNDASFLNTSNASVPSTDGKKEQVEAVNLELVSMRPYSGANAHSKGQEACEVPADPYEEYFVPVNEHRKYIRGEKLYVTKDKRSRSSYWRRVACWGCGLLVLALAVIIAILAATGVILMQEATQPLESDEHTSSRQFSDVKASGSQEYMNNPPPSPPPESSSFSPWPTTDETPYEVIPKALEGRLTFDDLSWTDELGDPKSRAYSDVSREIEGNLKDMLHLAENLSIVKVYNISKDGEVKFRISYPPVPTPEQMQSNIEKMLQKSGSMVGKYHLSKLNINHLIDDCEYGQLNCSESCRYDYSEGMFICSCFSGRKIDPDGKTCHDENDLSNVDMDEDISHAHSTEFVQDVVQGRSRGPETTFDPKHQDLDHVHRHFEGTTEIEQMSHEPQPTSEPKSEPEPISEPKSEPEPSSEPAAEPNVETVPSSEPERTSESPAEPNSTGEPKAEPEPSVEPEPGAEPKAEEPVVKPEPTSEPKVEPEPIVEPEPTSEPKVEPEPPVEPEPTSEPKVEPEPPVEREPTSEPKTEPEPSVEPESTSEPKVEPEPGVEPEPTSEPKTEPSVEPEPTNEPKAEPGLESEPTSEPKAEPGVEPEATSEPKPESEVSVEPEPTSEPRTEPSVEPEPTSEPNVESETSVDSEPTSEPKAEPEPQSEPEPSLDAHLESQSKGKANIEQESTAEPESAMELDLGEPNSDTVATVEPISEPQPSSEPATEQKSEIVASVESKSEVQPSSETAAEPNAEPAVTTESVTEIGQHNTTVNLFLDFEPTTELPSSSGFSIHPIDQSANEKPVSTLISKSDEVEEQTERNSATVENRNETRQIFSNIEPVNGTEHDHNLTTELVAHHDASHQMSRGFDSNIHSASEIKSDLPEEESSTMPISNSEEPEDSDDSKPTVHPTLVPELSLATVTERMETNAEKSELPIVESRTKFIPDDETMTTVEPVSGITSSSGPKPEPDSDASSKFKSSATTIEPLAEPSAVTESSPTIPSATETVRIKENIVGEGLLETTEYNVIDHMPSDVYQTLPKLIGENIEPFIDSTKNDTSSDDEHIMIIPNTEHATQYPTHSVIPELSPEQIGSENSGHTDSELVDNFPKTEHEHITERIDPGSLEQMISPTSTAQPEHVEVNEHPSFSVITPENAVDHHSDKIELSEEKHAEDMTPFLPDIQREEEIPKKAPRLDKDEQDVPNPFETRIPDVIAHHPDFSGNKTDLNGSPVERQEVANYTTPGPSAAYDHNDQSNENHDAQSVEDKRNQVPTIITGVVAENSEDRTELDSAQGPKIPISRNSSETSSLNDSTTMVGNSVNEHGSDKYNLSLVESHNVERHPEWEEADDEALRVIPLGGFLDDFDPVPVKLQNSNASHTTFEDQYNDILDEADSNHTKHSQGHSNEGDDSNMSTSSNAGTNLDAQNVTVAQTQNDKAVTEQSTEHNEVSHSADTEQLSTTFNIVERAKVATEAEEQSTVNAISGVQTTISPETIVQDHSNEAKFTTEIPILPVELEQAVSVTEISRNSDQMSDTENHVHRQSNDTEKGAADPVIMSSTSTHGPNIDSNTTAQVPILPDEFQTTENEIFSTTPSANDSPNKERVTHDGENERELNQETEVNATSPTQGEYISENKNQHSEGHAENEQEIAGVVRLSNETEISQVNITREENHVVHTDSLPTNSENVFTNLETSGVEESERFATTTDDIRPVSETVVDDFKPYHFDYKQRFTSTEKSGLGMDEELSDEELRVIPLDKQDVKKKSAEKKTLDKYKYKKEKELSFEDVESSDHRAQDLVIPTTTILSVKIPPTVVTETTQTDTSVGHEEVIDGHMTSTNTFSAPGVVVDDIRPVSEAASDEAITVVPPRMIPEIHTPDNETQAQTEPTGDLSPRADESSTNVANETVQRYEDSAANIENHFVGTNVDVDATNENGTNGSSSFDLMQNDVKTTGAEFEVPETYENTTQRNGTTLVPTITDVQNSGVDLNPITETSKISTLFLTNDTQSTEIPVLLNQLFSKCTAGQFQCVNGTSRDGAYCVSLAAKCDSENDCSDGSDELNCEREGCPGNFQCSSGQCLKRHLVCNGIKDCDDGTDEKNCEEWKCQFDEFKCPNGRCIPSLWQCNGRPDCENHTDEYPCAESCGNNEYMCPTEKWCIPLTWHCNGIPECANGEDEKLCDCALDQFKCQTGGCVSSDLVCDGVEHCPDHSDEWDCLTANLTIAANPTEIQKDDDNDGHGDSDLIGQATVLKIRQPNGERRLVCSDDWKTELSDSFCKAQGYFSSESTDELPLIEGMKLLKLKSTTDLRAPLVTNLEQTDVCGTEKIVQISCQEFSCGSHYPEGPTARLAGGTPAGEGQWSSVVLLKEQKYGVACTASVLSPMYALASYSCIHKYKQSTGWQLFTGADMSVPHQVKSIVPYPQVKYNQFLYNNDMALVELEEPLTFSRNVSAVCLPRHPIQPRQLCVTAGWGFPMNGEVNLQQYLKFLPVPTHDSEECNATSHYAGFITKDNICAGFTDTDKGPCYNDEGAPLMCASETGRWELQGLLSHHSRCSRGHPAIYSSLAPALSWLHHSIPALQARS